MIFITVMALYDLNAYKTVIKIYILHVYSMKKVPTFWGPDFVVLGF